MIELLDAWRIRCLLIEEAADELVDSFPVGENHLADVLRGRLQLPLPEQELVKKLPTQPYKTRQAPEITSRNKSACRREEWAARRAL